RGRAHARRGPSGLTWATPRPGRAAFRPPTGPERLRYARWRTVHTGILAHFGFPHLPGATATESREMSRNMPTSSDDRGRQAVEISNALTRSHRDHFGRGAGSVKTVIQGGYVITFLEDVYTPLERTLINAGKGDLVMEA